MQAKDYINTTDKLSKSQSIQEGQLSLTHGSVPCTPPPTAMPPSHARWDHIAKQLPTLIGTFQERAQLRTMPVLSASSADLDDKYLTRASIILSSLAHAYYYNENSVPVAERSTKDPLPECIEKPWQEVTQRLRPHLITPARTAFDSVLCNWKIRGKTIPALSEITLDDLELLVPIVGNEEERIFFITILLMEMKFAPALAMMVEAQSCLPTHNKEELYRCLNSITTILREVTSTISLISQNSTKQSYVDPIIWTKSVIKLEESIRPGEISGSGGSLPLFHMMDAFINRKYSSELGKQLLKFKSILPQTHREFIDFLGKEETSVIDYIIASNDMRLKSKCDEMLQAYENLLTTHMVKAFGYIYLSFNIGRKRTHGGNDETSHITEALKQSIVERRRALHLCVSSAVVISNKAIGGDAHEIIMKLPDSITFHAGNKCSIYPENTNKTVQETLQNLVCTGTEQVPLTAEWQAYFNKLNGTTESSIELQQLLRHADLSLLPQRLNYTDLVLLLKPLTPRLYSVAPIPQLPNHIRLTIKEIRHQHTATTGIASGYLCNVANGAIIKLERALTPPFALPTSPATPVVMFAGGTGIAPFIGFVDERASHASSNNYLFFSTTDQQQLYYQHHFETLAQARQLNFHPIFSREKTRATFDHATGKLHFTPDNNAAGYMNKLIEVSATELVDLIINKRAHIYVCGQTKFAENVRQGLHAILLPHFHFDANKTNDFLNGLMSNGSYHQDVFTRDQIAPQRQYSIAEVALHNGNDLWVTLNNKVYDLTQFAGQHPGGEKIFRAIAGKPADQSYQVINHHINQQINALLAAMQIGEIAPVNLPAVTKAIHAEWVKVLHEIVAIENILHFGFNTKNNYQEVYLHNSVFEAFINRYIHTLMAECLPKLIQTLGTNEPAKTAPLATLSAKATRLLLLTALIRAIAKKIAQDETNGIRKKLFLLQLCNAVVELSKKIVNAQKILVIKGILALEQQVDNYPEHLNKLLQKYNLLFQQYADEVDCLILELHALKNAEAPEIPNQADQNSVVIVGGGLTGIVLAAFFAKQGLKVTVYDVLPDPRLAQLSANRSINITLCERGLSPLREIGAYDAVVNAGVPAKGRMIHNADNSQTVQYYGNNSEALYSISRHTLAATLLSFVAQHYDVTFKFNEKCLAINPDTKQLIFINKHTKALTTANAAVIIGADGANSIVRKTLHSYDSNFSETKAKHHHSYKEIKLRTPPAAIATNMNYLHIWPRDNFILIGFPNPDGSMTLSLHIPEKNAEVSLEKIKSTADYHELFQKHFPDIYPSIKDTLDESYTYPSGRMVSMKCFPWIYKGNMALIGDAAHTLFPYYGQGANCAFEDCKVLAVCYFEHPNDWQRALHKFQALRKPNSDTIIDLAAKHLNILASKVSDPKYLLTEKVALAAQKVIPEFRTLYHNISFSTLPYREALLHDEMFQAVIQALMKIDNIEEKINSSEWPTLCKAYFAETLRKIALLNKTGNSAALELSPPAKSIRTNSTFFSSHIQHSSAGTLFFFKPSATVIDTSPVAQNNRHFFKVNEY